MITESLDKLESLRTKQGALQQDYQTSLTNSTRIRNALSAPHNPPSFALQVTDAYLSNSSLYSETLRFEIQSLSADVTSEHTRLEDLGVMKEHAKEVLKEQERALVEADAYLKDLVLQLALMR